MTLPCSYLHGAFVAQSNNFADNGAACNMTHSSDNIYDLRPPPPDRASKTIGYRRNLRVEDAVNIHVVFYEYTGERLMLLGVPYLLDLNFSLYSLHEVQ